MNWVVVKMLGIASMMFSICLGEKCDFVLFTEFWLIIELGFQLFVWQGRYAEAVVFFG